MSPRAGESLAVIALDAGMSWPANEPSQLKFSMASSANNDLIGTWEQALVALEISRIATRSSAIARQLPPGWCYDNG